MAQATPLLQYSGAAGLAWWRLRETGLRDTSSAAALRDTYRFQALRCAIHEEKIERIFRVLRQSSVRAIIAKGWAAARFYPDKALRAFGDVDILVSADQFERANELLRAAALGDCNCDLHQGHFTDLPEVPFDELWANRERVMLGGEEVAVLGREHHLRLLCLHFVRHSVWRSLWLCDVAAALESLPHGFKWNLFLGSDERVIRWLGCVIRLAGTLLGAKIDALPEKMMSQHSPAWLTNWVLKQWANPAANPTFSPALTPMLRFLRQPRGLWNDIRGRWPDPIVATRELHAIPNSLPRLPYQLAIFLPMAGRFVMRACMGQAKR